MTKGDQAASLRLGPRSVERPSDSGWTLVGTLDGRVPARVDGAGVINPHRAGWSLDWWIGADDRWYFPAREPTVRQRRLGPGPVVETTVRIPSGDARQLAYGALVAGVEVTVVEVKNDSPVPVALALAIRPYSLAGSPSPSLTMALTDQVVEVGSKVALVLPRPPNESGASTNTDLLESVEAGAVLRWPAVDETPMGAANGVLLYPLPHRSSLRFLVLGSAPDLSGRGPGSSIQGQPYPEPREAPEASAVARGWGSIVEAGGRFEFPDSGVTSLMGAARARLLLAAPSLLDDLVAVRPGSGAVLQGLALGGHGSEIEAALDALAGSFPIDLEHGPAAGAEVVGALGPALATLGCRPPTPLLETAMQLTRLVEKTGDQVAIAAAKRGLARLAAAVDDAAAANHLERRLPPAPAPTLAEVTQLSQAASAAGSWSEADGDDPAAAGRFVTAARSLLIDDSGSDLVLLPGFPTAWRGGKIEVHDIATRHGRLSFAVRWHGPRPALLWQLDDGTATMRCPDLDPSWLSVEHRGETLLAGVADGLSSTPAPGDSFG